MGIGARATRGQMTVELAVCIPAIVAVALVVVNAVSFMEYCASFDRHAHDAVRVYAASPAQGKSRAACAADIKTALDAAFSQPNLSVDVDVAGSAPGFATYTATLHFAPTLFGRSFSGNAFGVAIGGIDHAVSVTIDPYKPGAVM